ncbi:MAG: VWA domain-containing protein [Acidobacteria bacterium]|nr:MAG: VWA domain-containing protein [Acidobacteriota bacterium]
MNLRVFRLAAALVPLVVASGAPRWQETSPASRPAQQPGARISDQTYRVSVDLVNVFCSVWDRNSNAFITTLTRDDFAIYEDNKKQEISNFSRETNLPLTVALLIDTSQSVAPKLKFEQQAATNFFYSVLKDRDRAMLLEFDSGVTLVQDFTNDANKLAKQIKTLRAAGGTALYDALYLACDEKLIREVGRKAVVILSDGEDMSSKATFDAALEMALKAEATIFAISVSRGGFFGVGQNKSGDRVLQQLAEETGGRIFFPFKVEELEEAFQQIGSELRSQYNLGYFSANTQRDGTYRKIEVKLAEKGLRTRYRKGYYAPTH